VRRIVAMLRPPARMTIRDRRALTLMATAALVAGYSGSVITHTLTYSRQYLGITEGEMSWVFATTRAVSLLVLAFSLYGDRHGRRAPFLVAFVLLPVANMATSLTSNAVAFAAAQSFARLGVVTVAVLAIVLLAEELSPAVRAYGLGMYALAGAAGSGVSLLILPIAESRPDGFRIMFALSAAGLLAWPLLYRYLAESRAFVPAERRAPWRQVIAGGYGRHLWGLSAVAFFVALFSSPALNFAFERLIDDLAWRAGDARWLFITASGLGTTGLLVGGRFADLVGRRPAEMIALLLGVMGGVGVYLVSEPGLVWVTVFAATFGATILTPALAAHRSELFPTSLRATAGAWISNAAIVGGMSGFAIAAVVEPSLGLSTTMVLLGIGVLIAMVLVVPLPETRGLDLIRRDAVTVPTAATTPSSPPASR